MYFYLYASTYAAVRSVHVRNSVLKALNICMVFTKSVPLISFPSRRVKRAAAAATTPAEAAGRRIDRAAAPGPGRDRSSGREIRVDPARANCSSVLVAVVLEVAASVAAVMIQSPAEAVRPRTATSRRCGAAIRSVGTSGRGTVIGATAVRMPVARWQDRAPARMQHRREAVVAVAAAAATV